MPRGGYLSPESKSKLLFKPRRIRGGDRRTFVIVPLVLQVPFASALTAQEDYQPARQVLVLATSGGTVRDTSNQLPNVQHTAQTKSFVLAAPSVYHRFSGGRSHSPGTRSCHHPLNPIPTQPCPRHPETRGPVRLRARPFAWSHHLHPRAAGCYNPAD